MSLRAFHKVFIFVSILFGAFFTNWLFQMHRAEPDQSWLWGAILVGLFTIALVFYFLASIRRDSKNLNTAKAFFLIALTWPFEIFACAVCFGPAEKAAADALNASVFFMVGIVASVLVGLTFMIRSVLKKMESTKRT